MKVLAINGSPRGENSCTTKILHPLLSGMATVGAQTEIIYLCKLKINHCLGCFHCWTKTPGKCVYKDDMTALLQKYIEADILIYATPLYVFNVSGLMKNFIDRLLPLGTPFMHEDELQPGTTKHTSRYNNQNQKILLASPCGFPEFDHFEPLVHYMQHVAKHEGISGNYLGEILRPTAELMNIEFFQDKVAPYFENLKVAGKQLIENNKIDEELHKKLHELWISPEECRKQANEYFKQEIAKNVK